MATERWLPDGFRETLEGLGVDSEDAAYLADAETPDGITAYFDPHSGNLTAAQLMAPMPEWTSPFNRAARVAFLAVAAKALGLEVVIPNQEPSNG